MPKYIEEEDLKKPKRACDGLRADLKDCLVNSDCVRKVSARNRNYKFNVV